MVTVRQISTRLVWMDNLKLFAIFLVVLGHVVYNYDSAPDVETLGFSNKIRLYVYAFHMPLFITVSGYFSYRILQDGGNIMKRFKQLIVPCITLAVIFFIFGITTQNMWYLKSLFLCYVAVCVYIRTKSCVGGG